MMRISVTPYSGRKGYFLRRIFAGAIKDEVGFKNENMADCVVGDMHSFAKR